ncbi:hypothetical protein, partial [Paenibacillus contaminans]|uniref:hypothetical protein n=1 Tax=Paenibacillus contaminans TaxID=450362 RepID=UPI001EDF4396
QKKGTHSLDTFSKCPDCGYQCIECTGFLLSIVQDRGYDGSQFLINGYDKNNAFLLWHDK